MEKKVVLFDMNNLVMRCLFSGKVSPMETEFKLFKAVFMRSFLKTISDNNPNKVICCLDNTSWRKDICDTYKANRAAMREKSVVNFDAFFKVVNELYEKIKENIPNIQFLDVPKCEADDLIAVITKYNPDWKILNISTDKDFHQLFKYKNYSQYDGMKHSFVEVLNPDYELLLKIVLGDKSDNIQKLMNGIGEKKAATVIANGLDEWIEKNNLRERYEMNTKLVSFECIPQEYVENIKSAVKDWKYEKFNKGKFIKMILNEGMADVFEKSSEYINALENINE